MFTLRFDMRAPAWGAPAADLYAAAIDMCAWAETRGAIVAVLSEHHGADDGHLPSTADLGFGDRGQDRHSWRFCLPRCRFRCGIQCALPKR